MDGLRENVGSDRRQQAQLTAYSNVFIERLWRSVKYEDIYLRAYENGRELQAGLTRYFDFYNRRRIHQSHEYQTPDEIYYATDVGEPLAIAA